MDAGISESLLVALLKLLMKYLMDDSVEIVDMTSQALRVSFWSFIWIFHRTNSIVVLLVFFFVDEFESGLLFITVYYFLKEYARI